MAVIKETIRGLKKGQIKKNSMVLPSFGLIQKK